MANDGPLSAAELDRLRALSSPTVANAIETFDGKELDGRPLKINEAEERRRPSMPSPSYSQGGGNGGYVRPAKPKGSRRNLRRKKRSL